MRRGNLWLAAVLVSSLFLVDLAVPQTPNQKPMRSDFGPPPVYPPPSVEDVTERIMTFDKNKDGKVTRNELPERMHHLIAQGDSNKDGCLDRDEIRKLASACNADGPAGFGGKTVRFGGGQMGHMVSGRAGPGGPIGAFGFAHMGGPGHIEGVVDDLKLSDKKKDQALDVAKAHQEKFRKWMEQSRTEMLVKMKEILSEEEFRDFEAALDRPRGAVTVIAPDGPKR